MKIRNWYFCFIGFLLCLVVMPIMPHGDDFLYLNYFDNFRDWGIKGYKWVNNCILLPRGYWRPWEDLIGKINAMTPGSFPYLNHTIIASSHTVCAYLVFLLAQMLEIKKSAAFAASLFFLLSSTAMGGLLSIDSIAQVLVSLFGLLSVYSYCSERKHNKTLWIVFGIAAFFAKESGFVWIFVGPLYSAIVKYVKSGDFRFNKNLPILRSLIKPLTASCLVVLLYFVAFVVLKPDVFNKLSNEETVESTVENVSEKSSRIDELVGINHKTTSFQLSPVSITKNAFVLYGAALMPIDTSSIYYKNFSILIITFILSLVGLLFIGSCIIVGYKEDRVVMLSLFLILLWVSSVSLLTRAGEISPHPSNSIIALMLAFGLNKMEFTRKMIISIISFCLSTLITDAHKYSLIYKAGEICMNMGRYVVSSSKEKPMKVLCVTLDDNKKDGAFIINTASDFAGGGPVLLLYNYEYPKYRDIKKIPSSIFDDKIRIDSLVEAEQKAGKYDCIWFQNRTNIKVVNIE